MRSPRTWLSARLTAARLPPLIGAVTTALPGGGTVLDLGCGRGELAAALAAQGLSVTGVDSDPERLATAGRTHGERVRFEQADGRRLPYEDGQFDLATASMVFHGLEPGDRRAVLAELCRVARAVWILDYAAPLPRRPMGLFFRVLERASPLGHHREFLDFLAHGGLSGLAAASLGEAERMETIADDAMELWRFC